MPTGPVSPDLDREIRDAQAMIANVLDLRRRMIDSPADGALLVQYIALKNSFDEQKKLCHEMLDDLIRLDPTENTQVPSPPPAG